MIRTSLLLSSTLVLLSGCASIPEPLRGDFPTSTPAQADGNSQAVRWGGRVIDVLPESGQTCLEVLGMPLDASARPLDLDADIGRFRACKSGFLDPAVFISGREVTITGRVDGDVTRQIGDYSYRMPKVSVDALLLWPERPEIEQIRIHSDPFFGPWWGPAPVVMYPWPLARPHERR
ncbi:MAG: Slp family lipoprotein [Xanthomonadales bacterium]|nr:Slp family lipoprotein [Xanthomonadales bacterium]